MIMAGDYVTDRSILRFAEEVTTRFAFLETLSFHCVRSEATLVRFESSAFAVNVYHGRRSYEIGLEIESTRSLTETYSIPEILRLVDKKEADQYSYYASHTPQGVAEGVRLLAELFQRCVAVGILEDNQIFSRLESQRKDIAAEYALQVELRQAQRRIEAAWSEKDFRQVVKILAPLQEHLNPAELKKLEYARKHLNSST